MLLVEGTGAAKSCNPKTVDIQNLSRLHYFAKPVLMLLEEADSLVIFRFMRHLFGLMEEMTLWEPSAGLIRDA